MKWPTHPFPTALSSSPDDGSLLNLNVQSIQEPLQALQCKDFLWYLNFFSYIYRDAGYIPRKVFQLTPDGGSNCISLKRDNWGSASAPNDQLTLQPCSEVDGRAASSGTQYWHQSNRDSEGKCCSGLRAWNTDQCMVRGLSSGVCSLNPDQPAGLGDNGYLKIAGNCVIVTNGSLRLDTCSTDSTKWEEWKAFEPQEFSLLSQDMKDSWH